MNISTNAHLCISILEFKWDEWSFKRIKQKYLCISILEFKFAKI